MRGMVFIFRLVFYTLSLARSLSFNAKISALQASPTSISDGPLRAGINANDASFPLASCFDRLGGVPLRPSQRLQRVRAPFATFSLTYHRPFPLCLSHPQSQAWEPSTARRLLGVHFRSLWSSCSLPFQCHVNTRLARRHTTLANILHCFSPSLAYTAPYAQIALHARQARAPRKTDCDWGHWRMKHLGSMTILR